MTEADKGRLSERGAGALTIDTEPWLSCDDCFEQVDEAIEQAVFHDARLSARFRTHLAGCSACRDEARSLVGLLAGDAGLDVEEQLERFDHELAD